MQWRLSMISKTTNKSAWSSVFWYVKVFFCSTKNINSLTLKRYNSFQNSNNRKATHSFAFRPLSFKLQQEVLKFIVICVSLSSPKTELVTNFLNPENRSFENVSIVTFKYIFDISLLNNVFPSFLNQFFL